MAIIEINPREKPDDDPLGMRIEAVKMWGKIAFVAVLVYAAFWLAGCIAPQYHVHVGERHYHGAATDSETVLETKPDGDSETKIDVGFDSGGPAHHSPFTGLD